jgi:two-component sensor histidine kinase
LPEGFDIRQAESLGLQLIASLVEEQLQGQLEVIRNSGVEFLITFTESRQPNQARVSQVSV